MSQRNRSGRGSNRNNGNNSHGEEAQIWEACKNQMADIVAGINAENDSLAELVDLDKQVGATDPDKVPADSLQQIEQLCRKGVKFSDANVSSLKAVMEQLKIMRAVIVAKEQAEAAAAATAAGPGKRAAARDSAAAASLYDFDGAGDSPVPSPIGGGSSARKQGDRSSNRDRDSIPPKADSVEPQGSAASSSIIHNNNPNSNNSGNNDDMDSGNTNTSNNDNNNNNNNNNNNKNNNNDNLNNANVGGIDNNNTATSTSTNNNNYNNKSKVVFSKGDAVAFKPKAASSEQSSDWILGEVAQVLGEGKSRRYKVLDIEPDDQSKQKEYRSSASSMIPIAPESQAATLKHWEAGKVVLALYPNTTTFYKAEVHSMDGDGRVNLKFEGENDSTTLQQVERRFVIEYRA